MIRKKFSILIPAILIIIGIIPKTSRYIEAGITPIEKYTIYYETVKPKQEAPALELAGELKPYYSAQIYSKIDGILSSRLVNMGDSVKQGDVLATVDVPLIDADKSAAEADLAAYKKALSEADYKLKYAKQTYERYKNASVDGAVAVQELQTKETDYNNALMEYNIALQNVQKGKSLLKRAEEMKNYAKITAPFTGIITKYYVDRGSNIAAGGSSTSTALFELSQNDKLRLITDVPQSYFDRIKQNTAVKFYIPENPDKIYTGTIKRIQKSFNNISRTMQIEIITDNKNNELYPGMYVKTIIPQNTDKKMLLVKNEYIIADSNGTRVLTVNENNRLHYLPVEIGRDFGEFVEISKGLKGNEKIVTNFSDNLKEGQEVTALMLK